MTAPAPGITSIACGAHLGQAASVRGQSNQVLSEVLRAGRASTAELSPLSTPDSILMCYQKSRGVRGGWRARQLMPCSMPAGSSPQAHVTWTLIFLIGIKFAPWHTKLTHWSDGHTRYADQQHTD